MAPGGFDPIEILERARVGRRMFSAGLIGSCVACVGALVLGLLSDVLASDLIGNIAVYGMVAIGCPSAALVVSGYRRRHEALHQLAALDGRAQLPAARLV